MGRGKERGEIYEKLMHRDRGLWYNDAYKTAERYPVGVCRVKDSTERPLLNHNMNVPFIRELMESRREKYERAADIKIDTTGKGIEEICEELLQKLSALRYTSKKQ